MAELVAVGGTGCVMGCGACMLRAGHGSMALG